MSAKKNSTRDLIRGGIPNITDEDVNTTLSEIKNIQPQKPIESTNSGKGKEKKIKKLKASIEKQGEPPKKLDKSKDKIVPWFDDLIKEDIFLDDKDRFVFSLSSKCTESYDKLAAIYSYKKNIKIKRNDIMRKVLENFINYKFEGIKNELENIK